MVGPSFYFSFSLVGIKETVEHVECSETCIPRAETSCEHSEPVLVLSGNRCPLMLYFSVSSSLLCFLGMWTEGRLSFSFSFFLFLNVSPIAFKQKRVYLPWHDILNLDNTLVLNRRSLVSTTSLEAINLPQMNCECVPVPALQRQASARSVDADAGDYCFLGPRTSMATDLGVCVSLRVLPESTGWEKNTQPDCLQQHPLYLVADWMKKTEGTEHRPWSHSLSFLNVDAMWLATSTCGYCDCPTWCTACLLKLWIKVNLYFLRLFAPR